VQAKTHLLDAQALLMPRKTLSWRKAVSMSRAM